jgi:hypothetical protein
VFPGASVAAAAEDDGNAGASTQFSRACDDLNIEVICANSSQAKGRVERAHLSLQDRLVTELRLRGIASIEAGNRYLEILHLDYNRRFGKPPKSDHDSHRPLRPSDDLDEIFTWQEERKVTNNLVLHYKRHVPPRADAGDAVGRNRVDPTMNTGSDDT